MAVARAYRFALASAALAARATVAEVDQCPGTISVAGAGTEPLAVVVAQENQPDMPGGPVRNIGGNIMPEMWGRAYLAKSCVAGTYNNSDYVAWQLLGKKLTYTTDVSQAGCGCNAAMYLVSMAQNNEVSGCGDYYCDANSVCGVNCHEIDIQEANRYAFHTALHKQWDGNGLAQGYGGWVRDNIFDFGREEYGPGARCVDTEQPFQVSVAFPKSDTGKLRAVEMTLSQNGKDCQIDYTMDRYPADADFELLTQALSAGMTPVLSYWKASDMLWLDGPGLGGGPCVEDTVQCGTRPQFYGFSIKDVA
jgi:hypothetical protein